MSDFLGESELVAYCGIYCRQCDYFTGRIRASAKALLEVTKEHGELKLFAVSSKAFDYENFLVGLEWLARETSACIGSCRGGGGWGDCPIRKCCIERQVRFCYECSSFPCETLEKHPRRITDLRSIRKKGLEQWIREKLR